jgi:pyruvate/2-oxoglutarate dehydrogenase complex dihydrolipoamide acyltransferase (E2) component
MAQITMPTLGESVTEGTIGRWLKQPGEHVERDEPLVEVTTDKVNTEMPAPFSGTLRQIVAQEGMTVAVGAEIAIIAIEGEALADAVPATQEAIPAQAPILNQEGGEGAGPASAPTSSRASRAPDSAVASARMTFSATSRRRGSARAHKRRSRRRSPPSRPPHRSPHRRSRRRQLPPH